MAAFLYPLHTAYYLLYTICMNSYLSVLLQDSSTRINYVVDGEVIVTHTHDIGLKHIEADGLGTIASSKLIDGVMYVLEFISLHDRIPTTVHISSPRYASWLSDTITNASYTQFFTDGMPMRVTLDSTTGPSSNYARHTQTVFSFKV